MLRGKADLRPSLTPYPIDSEPMQRWRQLDLTALIPPAHQPDNGVFTFLSQPISLGDPPDWTGGIVDQEARDPALWQFHLHYLYWLLPLIAEQPEKALALAQNWVSGNPLGALHSFRGPWNPYTISLRLPVLAKLAASLPNPPDWLLDSIAWQTHFLLSQLEWEHGANHLLENLITLEMMRTFFQNFTPPPAFSGELAGQFPNGLHFEGSPLYHAAITGRLLALWQLLESPPHVLTATLSQAISALEVIQPPGEPYPLLGDSTLEDAPSLNNLMQQFPLPLSTSSIPEVRLKDSQRGDYLFFQYRQGLEASANKAHRHADAMHFEFWLSGIPIVCSGGAGHYGEGPERDALRSPREHATIEIDGEAPSDPWKSFRVGRLGRARRWRRSIHMVESEHSAFEWLGCQWRRRLRWDESQRVLEIRDLIAGPAKSITWYFPLSPILLVERSKDSIRLRTSERFIADISFKSTAALKFQQLSGKRWVRFGKAESRTILQFTMPAIAGRRAAKFLIRAAN